MKQRTITATLFFPVFLILIFIGSLPFTLMTLSLFLISLYEVLRMYSSRHRFFSLALYCIIYIGIGFYAFWFLRNDLGFPFTLFVLIIIWVTDSGAYLFGKKFGKRKLAPSISPNKTVEGFIGGIVFSLIIGLIFEQFFPIFDSLLISFIMIISISIIGQFGDLLESKIKRAYKQKDSGNLLPGHGGFFDRFDSLIAVFIFLGILNLFFVF